MVSMCRKVLKVQLEGVKRNGSGLLQGTVSENSASNWEKSQNRTTTMTDIRTRGLFNMKLPY
jgi:hypothetical protein